YVLFSSVAAHSYGDFVFGTELVVWTALGGRGTLIGPILGTVGVNYVSALLGGNLPFIWLLFVGLAFVLVVVYLPQGLVPAIGRGLSVLVHPIRQLLNRGWSASAAAAQPADAAVALSSAVDALAQRRSVIGTPDEAPVLELRDVGMQYGSLVALHRVSLKAYRGEVVGIIGPNGAGKTTLLRCIADGRERSTGEVLINGHRIDRLPPQR